MKNPEGATIVSVVPTGAYITYGGYDDTATAMIHLLITKLRECVVDLFHAGIYPSFEDFLRKRDEIAELAYDYRNVLILTGQCDDQAYFDMIETPDAPLADEYPFGDELEVTIPIGFRFRKKDYIFDAEKIFGRNPAAYKKLVRGYLAKQIRQLQEARDAANDPSNPPLPLFGQFDQQQAGEDNET